MSNVNIWLWVLALIIAYLLGNISPSTLLAKAKGIDIHKEGSGNAGTTNALRVMGKKAGVITLVVDVLKGTIAVLIGFLLAGSAGEAWCVLAVFCGHVWPVFYKFKGGKGVASTFGFILVINPAIALMALATWLVFAFLFKYSSLAALAAAVLTPLYAYFYAGEVESVFFTAVALLVVIRHHANIRRLIKGEESKISFGKKDKTTGNTKENGQDKAESAKK